ncbi:hypothetical protein SLA2020_133580 [Shorea laevis]
MLYCDFFSVHLLFLFLVSESPSYFWRNQFRGTKNLDQPIQILTLLKGSWRNQFRVLKNLEELIQGWVFAKFLQR